MPVIIRRAHSIFGDSIKLWRNVSHLLDTHGAAVFSASYFDATDPDERFGITPVEGGRYLQKPYRTSRSLAEVVRFDREDRLLVLEQACLRCPEEDADGGGPRAAEAARNASGPNRTGADGQDDTAGLRWRMFEEWSPPPFLGDLVVRQVNLWLGRLPVGGAGRPKESPTHFDENDNLMLQIRGSKVFWLYDAVDAPNLHPQIMQARLKGDPDTDEGRRPGKVDDLLQDNFSPVDPLRPDAARLPRSRHATPMRCELLPGEALYLPAFTWHHVVNYGEASNDSLENGLNIGVNAWFEGDARFRFLFESLMAVLRGTLKDGTRKAESADKLEHLEN